jgi:hypothetical protein
LAQVVRANLRHALFEHTDREQRTVFQIEASLTEREVADLVSHRARDLDSVLINYAVSFEMSLVEDRSLQFSLVTKNVRVQSVVDSVSNAEFG